MELLPDGEWELMMDGNRSVHQTLEEGKLAHQEFLRKAEIARATKDCVLTSSEQSAVDDRARALAQDDLAFGRISSGQFGQAVAQYAEKLTRAAKEEKVHTADLNRQIREAMAKVRGKEL